MGHLRKFHEPPSKCFTLQMYVPTENKLGPSSSSFPLLPPILFRNMFQISLEVF